MCLIRLSERTASAEVGCWQALSYGASPATPPHSVVLVENLNTCIPEQRAPRIMGVPIRTAHAAGSFRSQRTFPLSGGKVCARSSGKGAVRPVLRTKKESSHGKFRSEVCVRCLNHITVREPPFTGRAEATEGGKSLIVFNIGRIKVD